MIIKNLNLRSFGKFKEKKIEFGNGFNVVYGKNEAGKSTVSTAIKTYFYPDITVKKKYKRNCVPLGETKASYDVTVESDAGEVFESYVTLGKTNARTLVKTVKMPLGEAVDYSESMGKYFFSMDEELFDSIAYIKDLDSFNNVSANKEEVSDKLAKTDNTNVIDVNITEVIDGVKSELSEYTKKTSNGKIFPLKEELFKTEEELLNLENINGGIKSTDIKIEETKKNILGNEEQIKRLEEEKQKALKYEEVIKSKEQLRLRKEKTALSDKLSKAAEQPVEIPEEELEIIKKYSPSERNKDKSRVYLVSGIISFVMFVLLGLFIPYLFGGLLISAVLFSVWKKEKKEYLNKKEESERYNEILSKYNIKDYDDYNKKVKEFEKSSYENEIILTKLAHLEEKMSDFNEDYAFIEAEKPEITKEAADTEIKKLTEENLSLKMQEIKLIEQKKNAFNNLPDFDELKRKKEELADKISLLNEEMELRSDVLDILEKTAKSFKTSYIPFLNERTKEIINNISEAEIDCFNIDDSFLFELRTKEETEVKSADFLSGGTSDIVNFSLRLAIYELICDNYNIPLILDDCFIELDDERFEKIIKFLITNFKGQIFYFTAHKRIFNLQLEDCTVIKI